MVCEDTYLLQACCDFESWKPGQFVMVRINDSFEPFLRRPLGILAYHESKLELLYKVVGDGTRCLSLKKPGEIIAVLGPLGNGFRIPAGDEQVTYVAGGAGLPPILALAEHIKKGTLIIGARTRSNMPLLTRIQSITGVETLIVTDDGSIGPKALAADILEEVIQDSHLPGIVYACGPPAMLKKTALISQAKGLACQVSLEERMACGFGVCTGCIVATKSGNQRVCREGPVFEAAQIRWS
ncbi:MAG: dihydroorotate dehydrogenase electron transfer subunit [Deltaproteobacteria bacterium]|nr:dihydroorotate dehydrogenase electron transfer subunit [Deltaproteobacteria bacterium]